MDRVLVTGGAGFIGSNLADRLGHPRSYCSGVRRPGPSRRRGEPGLAATPPWPSHRADRRRHPRPRRPGRGGARGVGSVPHGGTGRRHHQPRRPRTGLRGQPARDDEPAGSAAAPGGKAGAGLRQHEQGLWRAVRHSRWRGMATPTCRPTPGCARTASTRPGRSTSTRPYGCSKGAADQYVLDYARSFGLPACVMRMSCIYGPRQRGTEDQGWLAHFLYLGPRRPADQHLRRRAAGAGRAVRG